MGFRLFCLTVLIVLLALGPSSQAGQRCRNGQQTFAELLRGAFPPDSPEVTKRAGTLGAREVVLSSSARDVLDPRHLPPQVISKYQEWRGRVERFGIEKVNRDFNYRDELLKPEPGRLEQHSIRLNGSYRLFYLLEVDGNGHTVIHVVEINKHKY